MAKTRARKKEREEKSFAEEIAIKEEESTREIKTLIFDSNLMAASN